MFKLYKELLHMWKMMLKLELMSKGFDPSHKKEIKMTGNVWKKFILANKQIEIKSSLRSLCISPKLAT